MCPAVDLGSWQGGRRALCDAPPARLSSASCCCWLARRRPGRCAALTGVPHGHAPLPCRLPPPVAGRPAGCHRAAHDWGRPYPGGVCQDGGGGGSICRYASTPNKHTIAKFVDQAKTVEWLQMGRGCKWDGWLVWAAVRASRQAKLRLASITVPPSLPLSLLSPCTARRPGVHLAHPPLPRNSAGAACGGGRCRLRLLCVVLLHRGLKTPCLKLPCGSCRRCARRRTVQTIWAPAPCSPLAPRSRVRLCRPHVAGLHAGETSCRVYFAHHTAAAAAAKRRWASCSRRQPPASTRSPCPVPPRPAAEVIGLQRLQAICAAVDIPGKRGEGCCGLGGLAEQGRGLASAAARLLTCYLPTHQLRHVSHTHTHTHTTPHHTTPHHTTPHHTTPHHTTPHLSRTSLSFSRGDRRREGRQRGRDGGGGLRRRRRGVGRVCRRQPRRRLPRAAGGGGRCAGTAWHQLSTAWRRMRGACAFGGLDPSKHKQIRNPGPKARVPLRDMCRHRRCAPHRRDKSLPFSRNASSAV